MIVVRTPFRIPLGGGSTDLPSYYSRHGGFIFAAAINLYMHITLSRPPIDDLIRFKYSESEEVASLDELRHQLGREALRAMGITKGIEVASVADVPQGTGLGSSGSYMVCLLHALHALNNEPILPHELADKACYITMETLRLPDGKQDPYAAALGGFSVLEIDPDGTVHACQAELAPETVNQFEKNSMLFYTGTRRESQDILAEQHKKTVAGDQRLVEQKHRIKEIGKKILSAFEKGNLSEFGKLMDEHWNVKRSMSSKMSSDRFDNLYDLAKSSGALGGKIMGAGGGGFFLFYAEGAARDRVRQAMLKEGLREVGFKVDFEGTKIIFTTEQ
ncbi:MAG: GHMP kinase [Parcubacteria group bacterium GW2011_GWB1_52_7]|nr:MAG: GHMP kinase [Parcubacteria group bacterium GW2011_GWB1_52_7]KKW31121.1 MAG: GHMP kinase [Parcubacteria group bacterium GW2011_GWC2_52_8c]